MEAREIDPDEAMKDAGMTLSECVFDSVVPACCSYGCMVEPDGTCEHGFHSVLIELSII